MLIKKVILTNFRGYCSPTEIVFNDFTAFVGRNDVGKSTVLEALDLFFNEGKGAVKLDKADITVGKGAKDYSIEVVFTDLPKEVVIDASFPTSLSDEFLLNDDGDLDIIKRYSSGNKFSGTYIRAMHPTNPACSELHSKKISDLRSIIKKEGIDCDNKSISAVMRKAIWEKYANDLQLCIVELNVAAGADAKAIWANVSSLLPTYFLFQSDRQNTEKDREIQDPLKTVVEQFFKEDGIQEELSDIAARVEKRLREVADRTLAKIREMDPAVADTLNPVIPDPDQLKWADVFKNVSITSDEDIPINKRGSGVKRLVLLNFFRAEAERRQEERNGSGIIYAIEEQETAQHFSNQKILAKALLDLANAENTQVILTTHSGVVVKSLHLSDLRMIVADATGNKTVAPIQVGLLGRPSLNEVNYIAFDEVTDEYHDELYGFIVEQNWPQEYESGKQQRPYVFLRKNGTTHDGKRTLTHYIRDVMHHPENTNNAKYTDQELQQSIEEMRRFIESKNNSVVTAPVGQQ